MGWDRPFTLIMYITHEYKKRKLFFYVKVQVGCILTRQHMAIDFFIECYFDRGLRLIPRKTSNYVL